MKTHKPFGDPARPSGGHYHPLSNVTSSRRTRLNAALKNMRDELQFCMDGGHLDPADAPMIAEAFDTLAMYIDQHVE